MLLTMNDTMPFSEIVFEKLEGGNKDPMPFARIQQRQEEQRETTRFGQATEGFALDPWSPLQAR